MFSPGHKVFFHVKNKLYASDSPFIKLWVNIFGRIFLFLLMTEIPLKIV
jgi:hypothetical protein